jgi:chemotaxis signal transduction protein
MSTDMQQIADTAAALQREFDRTFAEAVTLNTALFDDLLAIRIRGDPFALRLSEIMSFHADRKIVPVPSPVSELLGLAGVRGSIIPVYDLGALLGYSPSASPRWLVLAGGLKPIGLAFEVFEAHVRVERESSTQNGNSSSPREYFQGAAQVGSVVRPIIHVVSLLESISKKARTDILSKEQ